MCNLPIVGFALFEDDYSFKLSDIVLAIKLIKNDLMINESEVVALAEMGFLNLWEDSNVGEYLIALAKEGGKPKAEQNLPKIINTRMIKKRDAIRLYQLIIDEHSAIKSDTKLEPKNGKIEALKSRRIKTVIEINKEYPELKTKREVFEKCKKKNSSDFSIEFKSFSTGSTSVWKDAKDAGIIWKNIG